MTNYSRGDIVLLRHQFGPGDEEPRLRPALVVSSETYHLGRQQVVLVAITSSTRTPQLGDSVIQGWREAGLLGPSIATGVLLTAMPQSVERRLGAISGEDMRAVESSLRLSLGL